MTFWGTRGSIPVSGPQFIRHGGATTCFELECFDPNSKTPCTRVIVDGGTGLADLGRSKASACTQALIVQTHMHWDHVQGYPFFAPLFNPDAKFELWAVKREGSTLREVLDEQMQQPNFPITLDLFPAHLNFHTIDPVGTGRHGDLIVRWTEVCHPSGSSAYRFDWHKASVVFTGDVEVQQGCKTRLMEFAQGADILIMDAQYTPEEYKTRQGWGHSTPQDAVDVAIAAGVKRLILTHHDPSHDDVKLAKKLDMARQYADSRVQVELAYDRMEVALAPISQDDTRGVHTDVECTQTMCTP